MGRLYWLLHRLSQCLNAGGKNETLHLESIDSNQVPVWDIVNSPIGRTMMENLDPHYCALRWDELVTSKMQRLVMPLLKMQEGQWWELQSRGQLQASLYRFVSNVMFSVMQLEGRLKHFWWRVVIYISHDDGAQKKSIGMDKQASLSFKSLESIGARGFVGCLHSGRHKEADQNNQ